MNRPTSLSLVRSALVTFVFSFSVGAPLVPTALAYTHDNRSKILIALGSTTSVNPCVAPAPQCASLVTQGNLSTPYYAYLIVARGVEYSIGGVECGINYGNGQPSDVEDGNGIDIFAWTSCADAFFPAAGPNQWPRPGGGAVIVWDVRSHCQMAETVVAGYFYVNAYSPDRLQITRRPVSGAAKIANCQSVETPITGTSLGFASFGGQAGCNPCMNDCPDPPTPPYTPPDDVPPPPPPSETPVAAWVLLHTMSVGTGGNCARGRIEDPADAVVSAGLSTPGSGPFYHVYLLVARDELTSLSGVACGINYEGGAADGQRNGSGVDILSWRLCADAELRSSGSRRWPEPRTGNTIVWNPQGNCRTGAVEVAGYFYVAAYSADELEITPRPGATSVDLVNCNIPTTLVPAEHLGMVAFSEGGSAAGVNPWLAGHPRGDTPIQPATWSRIKTLIDR